jgi:glyceraldehyde 3-phosphate dehydrogenase
MTLRVGINGFGRIGRCVGRIVAADDTLEIAGINDLGDREQLAHLFKRDTVHGTFDKDIAIDGDTLRVGDTAVRMTATKDPSELAWDEVGADVVLECTGKLRHGEEAAGHLEAGASHVVISAPGKGDNIDYSVVYGVNHHELDPDEHKIIDNASCTTNCLAPVAKVMHEEFGIEHGLMTTVHSYTGSQELLDKPNKKDFRRARAAAENIVPTTTGAAQAVTDVLPELEGRLDGMAMRVPTPNVSLVDAVITTDKPVSVDAINETMKTYANGELNGVLGYSEEPLVSSDYVSDPRSSIIDADKTMVSGDHTAKIISWYDNEWGYSNRLVDVARYIRKN